METINVTIPSTIEHLSQIIAGFLLLNPPGLAGGAGKCFPGSGKSFS